MELQELCSSVCELSRETGVFIREESKKFSRDTVETKSKNSLVSYVDKTAEQKLVTGLEKLLPEAGFIAEEGTSTKTGDLFNWIIDPLDGTTNFIHGIPAYAISIALKKGDELILGVVYEINQDECFYAWGNGGAYLNGKAISVTDTTKIDDCLIATGFPYYDYERLEDYMESLKYYMHNTRGIRRLGSAATDLAYVAAGRFDCFYEYSLSPWDVAAGAVLVKEAGGIVTDFGGKGNFLFGREILACNKTLGVTFSELTKKFFKS